MKDGNARKEEKREHCLLDGKVVDREVANGIGDENAVNRPMAREEGWGRFLDILDEFMEQPQPNKFHEWDKIRLRNICQEAVAWAEGFVTRVVEPSKTRYGRNGKLVFEYEVVVDLFDPETLRTYGRSIIYADEDQLEPIHVYAIDKARREEEEDASGASTKP